MITKNEKQKLVELIANYCDYLVEYKKANFNNFEGILRYIDSLTETDETQQKLIERLNSYHCDLLMLDHNPYLAFDMNPEISLVRNNEVYDLLGINPPVESVHNV